MQSFNLHANKDGIDTSHLEVKCDRGRNDYIIDCRVRRPDSTTVVLDSVITGIKMETKTCVVNLCQSGDNCSPITPDKDPIAFTLEVRYLLLIILLDNVALV